MSAYAPNLAAGFASSNRGNARTYIDSNGDMVEEGTGEFRGLRLQGGEAFVSDSEEDSAGSGHYTTSTSGKKEKKKSKKHHKEAQFEPAMHSAPHGYEASSSGKKKKSSSKHREGSSSSSGGCCSGCQAHTQQPVQQAHQHGMTQGHPNGYAGYPAGGAAQNHGGRSYH